MHPDPEKVEKLLVDARARLVWGDSKEDVRNMLLENGLETQFVDNVMHKLFTERGRSMRKKGVRDLLIGVGIVLAATVWILLFFLAAYYIQGGYRRPVVGLAGMGSFAFFYGWYRIYRGADRLIFGAYAEGADSEFED